MTKQQLQLTRPAALLALVLALPAFAANPDSWTNLRSLQPGDRVGIVKADRSRIEGRFEAASDSAIVVETNQESQLIEQTNVVRVYKLGISRKKKLLIGAAAGLGAGGAVAATVSRRLNNEGFFAGPAGGGGTALALAGGAGIGMAVAALTGNGYETIYQKAVPKQ